MNQLIENIQTQGQIPGLDATPAGKSVYVPLGFQPIYELSRWQAPEPGWAAPAAVPAVEVGKRMIAHGHGGSIINISSLAATYGMPYAIDYATSKAAVIGMTRSLARELGRSWIRVNAVAPSAVLTEGTNDFMGEVKDKALAVIAGNQSLQANLTTDDMTGTIIYLASDASKFVTGQTIMVDGGSVML